MADYSKLYLTLLNTISTTIDHLKAAQCNVENAYIESAEPSLHIVPDRNEEKTEAAE